MKVKILGAIVGLISFSLLFSTWGIGVLEELKKPSSFVTLVSALTGITGAYFIANHQLNKTLKYSNPIYLQRFRSAQLNIDSFLKEAEIIEKNICTGERINAKDNISYYNFEIMRNHLEKVLYKLNPEIKAEELKCLDILLGRINQDAPVFYYTSMNGLIFGMISIYDTLLNEVKYLGLSGERQYLLIQRLEVNNIQIYPKMLKKFKRDYIKLKRELKL